MADATTAPTAASQIQTASGITLATMCLGVPYALAAKFCHPDRVAIALVGDGAMQMLGNNAMITAAKYWQQWSDPRLVILVLNNRDLNQATLVGPVPAPLLVLAERLNCAVIDMRERRFADKGRS